jgi:virginiamycin B lyase
MSFNDTSRRVAGSALAFAIATTAVGCAGSASGVAPATPTALSVAHVLDNALPRRVSPLFSSVEYTAGITPGANPRGIAKGPGGIWFTEVSVNKIARITSTGTVTEFPLLADSSGPNNLVEGPDHAMWFTEEGNDVIGRITSKGKVTEYPVGSAAYGPWDIAAGSDGNLWFTYRDQYANNAIGKITTAGAVTLYSNGLTPGDVAVHDMCEGPDGNIWFIEEFGNRVGRITPAGVITEFSAGITPDANLVDITGGADGNLWFTEYGADQIGRITPGGTVTEFSKGISPGASPGSITMAKGDVWFTEAGYSQIGRVLKNGAIKEFGITSTLSADIVAGPPASDLWVTDYSGNGLVQVTE